MKKTTENNTSLKSGVGSQFSDFFKPQNQASAKEALHRVAAKANMEQKAIIMSYRLKHSEC